MTLTSRGLARGHERFSVDEQNYRRAPLLEALREAWDGAVVTGFGLVVELIDQDGRRGVHKVTSDAGGYPLHWTTIHGLSCALDELDEVDADDDL